MLDIGHISSKSYYVMAERFQFVALLQVNTLPIKSPARHLLTDRGDILCFDNLLLARLGSHFT